MDFHPNVIASADPGFSKQVRYKRGTTSGKENGLSLLIDTESYDHGFKGAFNQIVLQCKCHKRNPKAPLVRESPFSFTTMATSLSWALDPSGNFAISLAMKVICRKFQEKYICSFRLSPGTDVEVNVVPQVTLTTEDAINKFSPNDRGCYACEEAKFRFMPGDPGKDRSEFVFGNFFPQIPRLVSSVGTATASPTASLSR